VYHLNINVLTKTQDYCTYNVSSHETAESLLPVTSCCSIHYYADEKLCAKHMIVKVQKMSNIRNRHGKEDHKIKHTHTALIYSHSTSLTKGKY
jgi:hypothetical protein